MDSCASEIVPARLAHCQICFLEMRGKSGSGSLQSNRAALNNPSFTPVAMAPGRPRQEVAQA
jgi:hypothetical protein